MNFALKEFATSLFIALMACFLPRLVPSAWDRVTHINVGLLTSLAIGMIWAVFLVRALIRHGKKGLWLFVGLPLVLYWPFVLFMLGWSCGHDPHQCP